jgi:hypothetical protein
LFSGADGWRSRGTNASGSTSDDDGGFLFVAGRRTIDTPYKNDVQFVGLGISMSTVDISFSPIKKANFLVF